MRAADRVWPSGAWHAVKYGHIDGYSRALGVLIVGLMFTPWVTAQALRISME